MAAKSIEFLKSSCVSWCKQVFLLVFCFGFGREKNSWNMRTIIEDNWLATRARFSGWTWKFAQIRENSTTVVVVFEDSSPFSYFLLIYDNFIGQLKSSRSSMLLMLMYYARALVRRRRCVCAVRDVIVFVLNFVETIREVQRFRGDSIEVDHFKTILLEGNNLIVGAK